MDTPEPARDAIVSKIIEKVKLATDEDLEQIAELLKLDTDSVPSEVLPLPSPEKPVVDTGMLTGPISTLKGFLLKKTREGEMKL